jgi:murein L,D-transpeptidase YcbB/YkuD
MFTLTQNESPAWLTAVPVTGERNTMPTKLTRRTFATASLATAGLAASSGVMPLPALGQKANAAPDAASTRDAIIRILNHKDRLPLQLERVRKVLSQHYIDNQGEIFWVGTGRMTPLVQRLEFAEDDGLRYEDYPVEYLVDLRDQIDPSNALAAGYTEIAFSAFFLSYAKDLATGRVILHKIDRDHFQKPREIDLLALLQGVGSARNPSRYLDTVEPQNAHYRALKTLLRSYREIAARGGWGTIDRGEVLKPGMVDARVPQLRARLEKSGDITPRSPADPNLYSEDLVLAFEQFQKRNGLTQDGVIGPNSLSMLNVSAEERMRQIIVNMERWRHMPRDMGDRHLMVNIAAFELYRYEDGQLKESRPVMVGKDRHQTPIFSDELEYVDINPTWTVPYSIATKEMLPKLQANPTYLGNEFQLLAGGKEIPFSSVNFNNYSRGNFPFTIRQKPGPKNALGIIKFMLPNRHAIYLHDTPSRALFAKTQRAFSHGCIRVYKPLEFGETILRDVPGWTLEKLQKVVDSRKLTRVRLPNKIPVHIVYATAWRGEGGSVEFRQDIYGRDKKLHNALFGKQTS